MYLALGACALILVGLGMWYFTGNKTANPWGASDDQVVVGTFSGTLPCADCAGIQTKLTLVRYGKDAGDGNYQLSETYLGESPSASSKTGQWVTIRGTDKDANAIVYKLNPEGPDVSRYFVKINEKTIRALDAKGNWIESDLPYTLVKE